MKVVERRHRLCLCWRFWRRCLCWRRQSTFWCFRRHCAGRRRRRRLRCRRWRENVLRRIFWRFLWSDLLELRRKWRQRRWPRQKSAKFKKNDNKLDVFASKCFLLVGFDGIRTDPLEAISRHNFLKIYVTFFSFALRSIIVN